MTKYHSARDFVFHLIFWPIVVVVAALAVLAGTQRLFLVLVGLAVLDVLLIWVYTTTYYVLDETELVIVMGPFRKRTNYHDIHDILETRDTTSAPALSFSRVALILKNGRRLLISPRDPKKFIQTLREKIQSH
ncbi:PH domain-containing protein [Alicyclobacillus mali (ex Roth et al. 2021)]|uniref:PH domain-containing protein n=1 Tax=Alicyclobacillus mali (ex Roth et al. 2021) TaxID=1123961 RepID=UPI001A8E3A86